MKILLHENAEIFAGVQASAEFKKALRDNAGKWVTVETEHLFNDQYNVIFGRVLDSMVAAVRDDARDGLGRCRYCGSIVRKGEEEKHFAEKENGNCIGCFWLRRQKVGEKIEKEEKSIKNGNITIVRHTWQEEKEICTFKAVSSDYDCCKKGCRSLGIEWFTSDNTFFLRYPQGLPGSAVIFGGECLKIDSYFLDFLKVGSYYRISNGRARLDFYIDDQKEGLKRIVRRSWGSSYNDVKIPAAIKEKALAIIDFRKMILQAILNGGGNAADFASLRNMSAAAGAILEKFKEEKGGKDDFYNFSAWLGGLPSCLSLPFATYEQKEILKNLGIKNLRRCSDCEIFDIFAKQVLNVLEVWRRWGGNN